jgi:hypothetical protein
MKIIITEEQKNNLFKPRNLKSRYDVWNKEQPKVDGKPINQYDKNGLRQGKWIEYFNSGCISELKTYKNDKLNGPTESYYELKCQLHSTGYFKNGLRHGEFHYYNRNGVVWCIDIYKNGNKVEEKMLREFNGGLLHDNTLEEGRVPRKDRIEVYKDDNLNVIFPLTHDALTKYSHKCQWCINNDEYEWEHYSQGVVIIQRNPVKEKIGISGMSTAGEILVMSRWLSGNGYTWNDVCDILGDEFEKKLLGPFKGQKYWNEITKDINSFHTNICYFTPNSGLWDMEDNNLGDFGFEIKDLPNMTEEINQKIIKFCKDNII